MHGAVIHEEKLNSSPSSYARSAVKPVDLIQGILSGSHSSFTKGDELCDQVHFKMRFLHHLPKWFDQRIYRDELF